MPRSPAPNISVPVFAVVGCWVEVVLPEPDPELFLSSLPQAARNSAKAPAPAVPPTALRNRLRSDGSVASRSMAPSCIDCLHVLLVEVVSVAGRLADQAHLRHNGRARGQCTLILRLLEVAVACWPSPSTRTR